MNKTKRSSSFFTFDFDNVAYLNLFRILAIFSVILLHIHMFGQTQVNLLNKCYFLNFTKYALAPVGFFFLLSGFLFNKVYLKRIVDKSLTGKKFWGNKFAKFFPFTLLTSVLFFIFSLIAKYGLNISITRESTRIIDLLLGIFLGGGEIFVGDYTVLNAALWYINILIFVYAVAYLLSLLYRRKPYKAIYLIPLFLGLSMGFLKQGYPFCNVLFGRGLTNFFLGFFLYDLCLKLSKLKAKWVVLIRCFSLFLIVFYIFGYFYFVRAKNNPSFYAFADFGLVNIAFWIPLMFLFNSKPLNKFATLKPIKFSCGLTFDIYIWHQPVFAVIEMIMLTSKLQVTNGVLYFFLINFSVLIIAALSKLFLDDRLKKIAKNLLNI